LQGFLSENAEKIENMMQESAGWWGFLRKIEKSRRKVSMPLAFVKGGCRGADYEKILKRSFSLPLSVSLLRVGTLSRN